MNKQSIIVGRDDDVIFVKMQLTALAKKTPEGGYLSYCPALDLYSQGDTLKEARKNIVEATELFIESCLEDNTLEEVLKECGFQLPNQKASRSKSNSQRAPKSHSRRAPDFGDAKPMRFPAQVPMAVFC